MILKTILIMMSFMQKSKKKEKKLLKKENLEMKITILHSYNDLNHEWRKCSNQKLQDKNDKARIKLKKSWFHEKSLKEESLFYTAVKFRITNNKSTDIT